MTQMTVIVLYRENTVIAVTVVTERSAEVRAEKRSYTVASIGNVLPISGRGAPCNPLKAGSLSYRQKKQVPEISDTCFSCYKVFSEVLGDCA